MTKAKYWGAYLNRLMIEDGHEPIFAGDGAAVVLRKIVTYVEELRTEISDLGADSGKLNLSWMMATSHDPYSPYINYLRQFAVFVSDQMEADGFVPPDLGAPPHIWVPAVTNYIFYLKEQIKCLSTPTSATSADSPSK